MREAASRTTTWSLVPESVGRTGARAASLHDARARHDGGHTVFDLGALSSWYRSSEAGIEQGFTVAHRPSGSASAFAITLRSGGSLSPVLAGPSSLRLVSAAGRAVLSYDDLRVTDARGAVVPSHLELVGHLVRVVVDDRGAVYPLTVDPFTQQAELTDPDGAAGENLGAEVALSADGSEALVGSNGSDSDSGKGEAFLFSSSNDWSAPIAELSDPDAISGTSFGNAVALSGDGAVALVGAPNQTVGLNHSQGEAFVFSSSNGWSAPLADLTASGGTFGATFGGAVSLSSDGSVALVGAIGSANAYLFSGTDWGTQTTLTGSAGFGVSVALSADASTALVGAWDADGGDGAAYLYDGSGWGTETTLTASDGVSGASFGQAVGLSSNGSVALVTAQNREVGSNTFQGVAYVFSGTDWGTPTELDASNGTTDEQLGWSGALSADGSTVLAGDLADGNAYLFNGTNWGTQTELSGPSGDNFGEAAAISSDGSTALIGDWGHDSGHGAAYVYTESAGATSQTITFRSSNPSPVAAGTTYTPGASSTSGLSVSITVDTSSTSVCSISAGVVSFLTAGTCLLDANQSGNGTYAAALQEQQSIAVKLAQSISFSTSIPSGVTVGSANYTPAASASPSGLPVTITLDSSSSGCTLSGGVVHFSGAGTCLIDANQIGNATYAPATQAQQRIVVTAAQVGGGSVVVALQSQTISFTSSNPSPTGVGATYTPTAISTSGLSVTITLDASSTGCTLAGGVVTITAAGATCVIDANQAGNLSYAAAAEVQQTVTTRKSQTLSFVSTNPSPVTLTAPLTTYVAQVSASSGLLPTITLDSSSTPGACTATTSHDVAGDAESTIHFTGPGTCVVDGNRTAGSGYAAAAQVQQQITVSLAANAPGEPTNVAATGGQEDATVTWSKPATNATGITGYVVIWQKGSTGSQYSRLVNASQTSEVVTGLVDDATYQFAVEAANASGTGAASSWVSATPTLDAPPAAPALTATVSNSLTSGDVDVKLSWNNPTSSDCTVTACKVSGYKLTYVGYSNLGAHVQEQTVNENVAASKTSANIAFPAIGTSDTFTLVASNSRGSSPDATATVVLEEIPEIPDVEATAGVGLVALQWRYDGTVAPVSSFDIYEATTSGQESTVPLASSAYTFTTLPLHDGLVDVAAHVTGLEPGTTYYFKVAQTDAAGTSDRSAQVSATTPGVPGAPTGLVAVPGNREVQLIWTAPTTTGGSPITGYGVFESVGRGVASPLPIVSTTSTSVLLKTEPPLQNGTDYHFTVRTLNAVGVSAASNEVAATPAGVPDIPTDVTATPGGGQVTLDWTAPSSTGSGSLTGYRVYEGGSAGGESSTPVANVSGSATTATVTGLTAGDAYFFYVTAVNSAGQSFPSDEVSATPSVKVTPPSAPLDLTATAGNRVILLHWNEPASNGQGAITGYEVLYGTSAGREGSQVVASTTSTDVLVRNDPATIANGSTYYFVVKALNSGGAGAASNEASATPEPVPGSPTSLSATAAVGSVALSWTPPSSTGAGPITSYEVYEGTASGGESTAAVASTSATTATVTGLTGGKTYYFDVRASNVDGAGFGSNEASAVPTGPPAAPTDVRAKVGGEQVTVSWVAPTDDGGTAITGYDLLWRKGTSGATNTVTLPASSTSDTVTSLVNGVGYEFAVEATNAAGTGAQAEWVDATPSADVRPLAPPNFTATVTSSTTPNEVDVQLAWQAPPDGGCPSTDSKCQLSGYELQYDTYVTSHGQLKEQGVPAVSIGASKVAWLVKDLPNLDKSDTFELYATNGWGDGAQASVTVTLEPPPTTPVVTASPGEKKARLTWRDTSGSPVTANVYEGTTAGGESATAVRVVVLSSTQVRGADGSSSTEYTATVGGLTDGTTYYFTLTAKNDGGTTPMSNEVSVAPAAAPGPPTGLVATAGNAQIELKWKAPADTGGPITGYDVYAGPDSGGETVLHPIKLTGTATSTTLVYNQGFFNGGTYYIEVEAVNASGNSAPSNEVSASPLAVPTAPTGVTAVAGNGEAVLSWTAPGGATSYDVFDGTSPGGEGDTPVASPSGTSTVVSGLTNGTTYYFVVQGVSSLGIGNPSTEVSLTPAAVPGSPTGLTAKAADKKIVLSWTAPTGGAPVTGYDLYEGTAPGQESSKPVAMTIAPTATSATVNGLTDGTAYFFTLAAVNAAGTSPLSNETSTTPAALPGAPTDVVATPGSLSVELTWTASASDGGSPITGYDVFYGTSKGGEGTQVVESTTTTRVLVRNDPASIHNGTTYYFTVKAVNSAGPGAASAEVSATPAAVPGNPTSLTASSGVGQITVSWTAPAGTGGSAITGYKVYEGAVSGGESSAPVATASGTSATVTGLQSTTTYYFTVKALNANGASFASNEAFAVPTGPPGVPVAVKVEAGYEQATVEWSAPTATGGKPITGYTVLWRQGSSGAQQSISEGASVKSSTIDSLADGTEYEVAVEATNALGTGSPSAWLDVTPSVDSPPPAPVPTATVTESNTTGMVDVKIGWTNPTASGCADADCKVSGYTLTEDGGAPTTLAASATSFGFSRIGSGDVETITLTAADHYGRGPTATTLVVPALPPAVPVVTIGKGSSSGELVLKWSAARTVAPVTGFAIYEGTSTGGESSTPLASSAFTASKATAPGASTTSFAATITGLTSGTTYYFTVTDTNAAGTSPTSHEESLTAP